MRESIKAVLRGVLARGLGHEVTGTVPPTTTGDIERAAVLRFLRGYQGTGAHSIGHAVRMIIEAIERGEHVR